jgi:hypothetical protein
MFNVSIRECFSVLNMSIVCIRNMARSKSIPLLCTHVDPYKFSTVHPPREDTCTNLVLVRIWKQKRNDDKRRVPTYLLVYFRPLIAKKLNISVEHGRVTTLNVTKH